MAGAAAPGFFTEAVVLLGAAVVAAPLFKRAGLGTVLGYLAAGVVVGPVLRLVSDAEDILTVSELGVVFLLFIIGLELNPKRLWAMRREIFGLGASQVIVTGFVLSALTLIVPGMDWRAALVIGFGLALSSTAFGLQILEERGELTHAHGQRAFSILLFQDIAIVPLLAIVPFLAVGTTDAADGSGMVNAMVAIGAVGLLVIAGRYLLTPLFRIIGNTGAREAMLATALLVVLGAAFLMQLVGLSMALGAFIAGVMLAESSYRHELEADIEPFRGLLLGLFFMAIGLSLDLATIYQNWLTILIAVPVLMAVKAALIYGLCGLFGGQDNTSIKVALTLPQAGEFGFVLFAAAGGLLILDPQTVSVLIAIVTLTMAFTPLCVSLAPYLMKDEAPEEMDETFEGAGSDVLMIGFSRFGQVASQILLAGGSDVTIIDHSAERVRSAGKFGFRIYFGDGTRREVLEAAGIRRAKVVAVCTHTRAITDRVVDMIQSEYPDVKLFVRAYDRTHAIALRNRNVDFELRETFESGLLFGKQTLQALGVPEDMAHSITDDVRRRDAERLRVQVQENSIHAGRDMLHTRPVSPEPLTKPRKESKLINEDRAQESPSNPERTSEETPS